MSVFNTFIPLSKVLLSWIESSYFVCAITLPLIYDPIVQAVVVTLPELNAVKGDPEAPPVVRSWDFLALESLLNI